MCDFDAKIFIFIYITRVLPFGVRFWCENIYFRIHYTSPLLRCAILERKPHTGVFLARFSCRQEIPRNRKICDFVSNRALGPILCEIENADRKRKTAFFDLDFSIRKKSYLRPDLMRDRKRRSKTENGVFRSGFFDQKKNPSYLEKSYYIYF